MPDFESFTMSTEVNTSNKFLCTNKVSSLSGFHKNLHAV